MTKKEITQMVKAAGMKDARLVDLLSKPDGQLSAEERCYLSDVVVKLLCIGHITSPEGRFLESKIYRPHLFNFSH